MKEFNLEELGDAVTDEIKNASWFPFKTGKLKFNATSGELVTPEIYRIRFDGTVAPYIQYLEEGTNAHNIPQAFGKPLPFGVGGKFDLLGYKRSDTSKPWLYFHPGSKIHRKFIGEKSVKAIIKYIWENYNGVAD